MSTTIAKRLAAQLRRSVLANLPAPLYVAYDYRRELGRWPDLRRPQRFTEKLQWIKLRASDARSTMLADKLAVRHYVRERVGEAYLTRLYGVYGSAAAVDPTGLPDSFVLKPNHGSGWNIVCRHGDSIDWNAARARLDAWLRTDYWAQTCEQQYRRIPRRILCEELLLDDRGTLPKDYRVFCFGGEARFVLVDYTRPDGVHTKTAFDAAWTPMPIGFGFPTCAELVRPDKLPEMISVAQTLAKDLAFVRVDLYHLTGRIAFSEMTLTPSNGVIRFVPDELDYVLGSWLALPQRGRVPHSSLRPFDRVRRDDHMRVKDVI